MLRAGCAVVHGAAVLVARYCAGDVGPGYAVAVPVVLVGHRDGLLHVLRVGGDGDVALVGWVVGVPVRDVRRDSLVGFRRRVDLTVLLHLTRDVLRRRW